jgi:hypothetical protein
MDATASREATWDQACHIQAEMFTETAKLGGLRIQLCYYRGFKELSVSPWLADSSALAARMTAVTCAAGLTQIGRVLEHALSEGRRDKVNALVFVGDCMEEGVDDLRHLAGQVALLGMPIFLFQEGRDEVAERAFREIARLTRGAYSRFDSSSPRELRDLLGAVAVYAAGGGRALADFGQRRGAFAQALVRQLSRE